MRRAFRAAAAALLMTASAGGSVYYLRGLWQDRLLSGDTLQQVVAVPAALLPRGASQRTTGRHLTVDDRRILLAAIWRDPLNQRYANTLYADAVTSMRPRSVIDREARLLADLGWRNTPAQQNLLLRDALAGNYAAVLDRGDALLRRQKVQAVANTMLAALEASPIGQRLLTRRLLDRPDWRSDYLVATSQAAAPPFLLTRAHTLDLLMDARSPIERREIAPVLSGLLAGGHGREALTLWHRFSGWRSAPAGNLLVDPAFDRLRSLDEKAGPSLAFEWQAISGPGADVSTSSSAPGLEIEWNGRGVPTFATQWVAVQSNRAYLVVVRGQANATTLAAMIRPGFVCGNRQVVFDVVRAANDAVTYRSDPVPSGCDIVELTLGASLRDDAQPVSATLTQAALTPL